jgi:uridine kinase
MSQTNQPGYVIGLSGPSGAGKSTVIQALSSRFGNAVAVGIDEYEASSVYPDSAQWLAEGADPNMFQTPQFLADVRALRSGRSILAPTTSAVIQPTHVLIVEEPFGRGRDQMRDLIDFVVYVDLPLEIALARKILRQNAFLPWEQDPDVFIAHLREFLGWYLRVGRSFYLAVGERVLRDCDLVVDGTRPTEEVVEAIVSAVQAKNSNPSSTPWQGRIIQTF